MKHCNPCTVSKFLELSQKNIPLNWWAECGLSEPVNITKLKVEETISKELANLTR